MFENYSRVTEGERERDSKPKSWRIEQQGFSWDSLKPETGKNRVVLLLERTRDKLVPRTFNVVQMSGWRGGVSVR